MRSCPPPRTRTLAPRHPQPVATGVLGAMTHTPLKVGTGCPSPVVAADYIRTSALSKASQDVLLTPPLVKSSLLPTSDVSGCQDPRTSPRPLSVRALTVSLVSPTPGSSPTSVG